MFFCNPKSRSLALKEPIWKLEPEKPDPVDGHWTLDADKNLVRHAIGASFAGTDTVRGEPLVEWVLSHVKFSSQEERVHTLRFMMTYPFLEDLRNDSFQLCAQAPDGEIVSFASVQDYDSQERARKPFQKLRNGLQDLATIFQILFHYKDKVPPLFRAKDRKKDLKRFEAKLGDFHKMAAWHHEFGPKIRHWYVHIVGVNPNHNGQGRGRELMQKLNEMADTANQAMYLEAGDRNRGFYEKMGFVVKHTKTYDDPTEPGANPFLLHLMIREPSAVTPVTGNVPQ